MFFNICVNIFLYQNYCRSVDICNVIILVEIPSIPNRSIRIKKKWLYYVFKMSCSAYICRYSDLLSNLSCILFKRCLYKKKYLEHSNEFVHCIIPNNSNVA